MAERTVFFLAEAEEEAGEALAWYQERSASAAEAFTREMERAVALISESPSVWPIYLGRSQRYVLRRFPFDLVYRVESDLIVVVAIAHHQRKPGYWRGRPAS